MQKEFRGTIGLMEDISFLPVFLQKEIVQLEERINNLYPYHNPNQLTANEIGVKDGWRALNTGELVPKDAQVYICGVWVEPYYTGIETSPSFTYRSKTK